MNPKRMNPKRSAPSLAALWRAVLLVPACALAQTGTPASAADTSGPYIGMAAGVTNYRLNKQDFVAAGATQRSFDTRDSGFKVFVGYRFNEHFGVELQHARLGDAKVRYRSATTALGMETYEIDATSIAAVGTVPATPVLTLFGKAGPSFNRASSKFSSTSLGANARERTSGLLLGIGASIALTDSMSLRAEIENFAGVGSAKKAGRSSVLLGSVGVSYRF